MFSISGLVRLQEYQGRSCGLESIKAAVAALRVLALIRFCFFDDTDRDKYLSLMQKNTTKTCTQHRCSACNPHSRITFVIHIPELFMTLISFQ